VLSGSLTQSVLSGISGFLRLLLSVFTRANFFRALLSLVLSLGLAAAVLYVWADLSPALIATPTALAFSALQLLLWKLNTFDGDRPTRFDPQASKLETFEWNEDKFNKVLREEELAEDIPDDAESEATAEGSGGSGSATPAKSQPFGNSLAASLKSKAVVIIAVLGEVKCGKTSLLKALFSVDPADTESSLGRELVVNSLFDSAKKSQSTVLHLDNDVVLLDLPGLHQASAVNQVRELLQPDLVDVAIFVVNKVITNTVVEDYRAIVKIAKKTFVVYNKMDELDYLKEKDRIIDQWRQVLNVATIYLTATKGYDPDADHTAPNWQDFRGVDELREVVLTYLRTSKKGLLMSKHMMVKNKPAVDIILLACVHAFFQSFLPDGGMRVTATHIRALTELHFLYSGQKLRRSSAERVLLSSASGTSLFQSLYYFAKWVIPIPGIMVDFVSSVLSAGSVIGKTAAVLIAAQQLLTAGLPLTDPRLPTLNERLQQALLPKIRNKLFTGATTGKISTTSSMEVMADFFRGMIQETMEEDHLSKLD